MLIQLVRGSLVLTQLVRGSLVLTQLVRGSLILNQLVRGSLVLTQSCSVQVESGLMYITVCNALGMQLLWPPHINNALVPVCVCNAHHMLVIRWFNMVATQAGDDCLGNECSDIEAEPMR